VGTTAHGRRLICSTTTANSFIRTRRCLPFRRQQPLRSCTHSTCGQQSTFRYLDREPSRNPTHATAYTRDAPLLRPRLPSGKFVFPRNVQTCVSTSCRSNLGQPSTTHYVHRPIKCATTGVVAPTHSRRSPPHILQLYGKKLQTAAASNTSFSATYRRFPSRATSRHDRSTNSVRRLRTRASETSPGQTISWEFMGLFRQTPPTTPALS
jgi:hypothetical protein